MTRSRNANDRLGEHIRSNTRRRLMNSAAATLEASARGRTIVFMADTSADATSTMPATVASTRRAVTEGQSAPA